MTPTEMQNSFLTEIKAKDHTVIGSDDIFYYLNKAQENWIKEKFAQGFELTQSLTDDLKTFFKKDVNIDASYGGSLAQFGDYEVDYIDLPSDYLHLISQRSKVNYSFNGINFNISGGSRVASGKFKTDIYFNKWVQSDDIYQLLSDPFNTTKHTKPLSDINDQRINIYTNDRFIIDEGIINYIREPKEIDPETGQSSELPNIYHKEIVEQAVALYSQFSAPSANSQDSEQEN